MKQIGFVDLDTTHPRSFVKRLNAMSNVRVSGVFDRGRKNGETETEVFCQEFDRDRNMIAHLKFNRKIYFRVGCDRFTLIELLVVISIIVVLLSILLPALKKTKDKTYEAVCKNKLKQINLALVLYRQENNDFLPYGISVSNNLYNNSSDGGLASYLNVPTSFNNSSDAPPIAICPVGGKDGTRNLARSNNTPNYSYAMNYWMSAVPDDNRYTKPSRVNNPSTRVFIGGAGLDDWSGGQEASANGLLKRNRMAFRHSSGANACFLDGHVTLLRYNDVPEDHNIDPDDFWRDH